MLVTVYWHARDTGELGAGAVQAPARSARPLCNREIAVSNAFRAGEELPGGIQAYATPRVSEVVVFRLPDHDALVVGDVLLGPGAKPNATDDVLRLCRERWRSSGTHDDLGAMLAPLLELPVERILTFHGEPVLSGGREALARVLA